MKKSVNNLILGSGITGLSCGLHLGNLSNKKGGFSSDYLILEKEKGVGGLARSIKKKGFVFDYSAHLLHCRDPYFSKWVENNLKKSLKFHKRNAWVYSHGVFTKYPFQANLYGLPRDVIKDCLLGLLSLNGFSDSKPNNFEEWCYNKFGSGISKHFMLPYNEKFWNIAAKKITLEWIDGFIPQPQLRDMVKGGFEYSHKEFGYHSKFYYPINEGIELIVKKISSKCSNIVLKEKAEKINLKERWVLTSRGRKIYYNNLVSTLPMVDLNDMIIGIDSNISNLFRKLKYISVINVNMGIKRPNISDKDWVYFPEDNFSFYRIGFPMNFAPSSTPSGFSSIYIDISYSGSLAINKRKESIIERVKADLIKLGIIGEEESIPVVDYNDIKYAYILYDKNWSHARGGIIDYLLKNSVYSAGRFGSWSYLSMEGCFLEGRRIANILKR
ncbi:MAG: FAD-dependent oxidoreductase [Candidatus Kaelpia imicola]|nr:FAD-dependent oxidoreductase [Candidatus Kaelpia imicola]